MSKTKKILLYVLLVVVVACVAFFFCGRYYAYDAYKEDVSVRIVIPKSATEQQISDSLTKYMDDFGEKVFTLWKLRHGDPAKSAGIYYFYKGEKAWDIAGQISSGLSSNQKVTFNNVRLVKDLANRVASGFDWTDSAFMAACDSILPTLGYKTEEFPAAFIPDTYLVYATASPEDVVNKLVEYRDRFWNEERKAKAKKLGLTPVQVATVASIVEEESKNTKEQPTIARLYLNRIDKGMKLQADPTVKFAIGDFGLKRILKRHLTVDSPYNTYLVEGLPPGPIRIPAAKTMDFVLDAPQNDYLFMCAKPELDGTHNFTSSAQEHERNAKAYQAAINALNIK